MCRVNLLFYAQSVGVDQMIINIYNFFMVIN